MNLILIIILVLLICGGGGYGASAGWYTPATFNGLGLLPILLVCLLIFLLVR